MLINNINNILRFLLLVSVFSSCTKVIDVDINEANQRIVVDAHIDNNLRDTTISSCRVHLTKTSSFYDNNSFEFINNADLYIKTSNGISHKLISGNHGYYTYILDTAIQLNEEVELYGLIEGEEIKAKSIMPRRVKVDSIIAIELPFGPKHKGITPICFFTDYPGEDNYYRLILSVNNVQVNGFYVTYDLGHNGGLLNYPFMGVHVEKGDTVKIDLLGISKFDYDYYRVIIQTQKSGGFSAAPGNPNTNIEGNAIGVFTAETFNSKSIIVQ